MHEFSIMQNLLKIIEKEAEANSLSKVNAITVKIGKLRQVVPEFIEFAFTTIAKDTVAANAKLNIESIPITIHCGKCNQDYPVIEDTYTCPKCDSIDIKVITGKEIILASIEGDR